MAATLLQSIVTSKVRPALNELTARFWTDAELLDIMKDGIHDLWGAILDIYGDHYLKINDTDVVLRSGATSLSGVPSDCFRVQLIEPRDISLSGSGRAVVFAPRKYKHPEFVGARTQSATDPASTGVVFYQVTGEGAPAEPPRILTAPMLTSDLLLRFAYNPTITIGDTNPIPGESDMALKAWTMAWARAKERDDRSPDTTWLTAYSTERQHILTRLTPRQEDEPEVVEDFFGGY